MNNMLLRRRIMLGLASSPFSPEATAILKEDFPDEWNDIKAYGYANREMVPYINEDPYFVVSLGLVSGVERWLIGNDSAYIDSGFICNQDSRVRIRFKKIGTGSVFGSRVSTTSRGFVIQITSTNSLVVYYGSQSKNLGSINDNTLFYIDFNRNNLIVNNQLDIFDSETFICPTNAYISAYYNGAGIRPSSHPISKVIIYDNDILIRDFLPCKNPNGNDYGMLDLTNLTYYGNAADSGAFTIEYSGRPYLNITSTTKTYIINTYGESAWNTVKEFFTNPNNEYLVKYVNNDPDIVCSLVDIGYTRYLVGDGTAYIDTNSSVTNTDRYELYAKNIGLSSYLYGNGVDTTKALTYYLSTNVAGNTNVRFGNTYFSTAVSNLIGNHTIVHDATGLKLDNSYIGTYSNIGTFSSDASIMLFAARSSTGVYSYISNAKIAYFNKYNTSTNTYVYKFIPCKNPNGSDYGMLDIINDVFYPNANSSGAFTISIEQNS